jgi:carbonic anhydrase
MNRLFPIDQVSQIPPQWRDTPIGLLVQYQNLDRPFDTYNRAALLIGMCMDNRKTLRIPDNFAYILRSGGANLRYSEFKVSYAIAVGRIKSIALIAHNNCGMVNLISKKQAFIEGLVEAAGWDRERAEEHFMHYGPMYEVGNETDFVLSEAKRLRLRYPTIQVAPLYYRVDANMLYQISEEGD